MKLKVNNEDFKVRENTALSPQSTGEYGVYTLKKAGWNTTDALMRAARQIGVPYSIFSYGGRKDKHAVTEQTVTARSTRDLTVQGDNYELKLLGRSDRPMGPDLITANAFEITLRALSDAEVDVVTRRYPQVRASGFPNFFDDQRFGGMDKTRGFLAERILKGHWKGAVQLYLTLEPVDDTTYYKSRRKTFEESWGNWRDCLSKAESESDQLVLEQLVERPSDFISALQRIPREELSIAFSAYQGFLWNDMLRRLIRRLDVHLEEHPGDSGAYLFYGLIPDDMARRLSGLELPTVGSKPLFSSPDIEVLYDSVLLERGLHRGSFNLRRLRQAYFKSFSRNASVIPSSFLTEEAESDEQYKDRLKMAVKFELPRGCYGTMCVKALLTDI